MCYLTESGHSPFTGLTSTSQLVVYLADGKTACAHTPQAHPTNALGQLAGHFALPSGEKVLSVTRRAFH